MEAIRPKEIGTFNEYSLHSQLKDYYCANDGEKEKQIENYIVDVLKKNELIEIQSKNFSQIKSKLMNLLEGGYKVRLVYPLVIEKWISTISLDSIIKKRKSPKKLNFFQLFHELVYLTDIFSFSNFKLEVLMISVLEERKQVPYLNVKKFKLKIVNRTLVQIQKKFIFDSIEDFLFIFPPTLPKLFSTKELIEDLKINYKLSSKIIYVLKKLKIIEQVGKKGNRKYFQKSIFL